MSENIRKYLKYDLSICRIRNVYARPNSLDRFNILELQTHCITHYIGHHITHYIPYHDQVGCAVVDPVRPHIKPCVFNARSKTSWYKMLILQYKIIVNPRPIRSGARSWLSFTRKTTHQTVCVQQSP